MPSHQDHVSLIWQIADLLRGPYRPPQYERVMLPMTVLRRFDSVLAPTKAAVVEKHEKLKDKFKDEALDSMLNKASGQRFHNHSPLDFEKLRGAPDSIARDLVSYINGFSANVRRIFDSFKFGEEIETMAGAGVLYQVVLAFANVDLHPTRVPNAEMGRIFEHLIRRFNELANETAGDYFTPPEVVKLMVHLLFLHDDALLSVAGTVRKMLDPACGTGGMLAGAQDYLRGHNLSAKLYAYGQDHNPRAYATAASDMLIKEVAHNGLGNNIQFGDSLVDDQFDGVHFDYLIANPPFGVDWKKQQREILRIHEKQGFDGPFGAGLPRVNDGAFLFLQKMLAKMEPVDEAAQKWGSRIAVVFSGSPLFAGGAGSGESDIRKWIIENDWLEAVVALPEQMFYNTGIGTYIWVLTNRKEPQRRGKIALVDARAQYIPMRKSQGDKRRKIGDRDEGEPDQMGDIVRGYGAFREGDAQKIFDGTDFGYTRVTVERPLRLRFDGITDAGRERFLEKYPHHAAGLDALDAALGRASQPDWNAVAARLEKLWRGAVPRWADAEKKAFRSVFGVRDAEAEIVLLKTGAPEPDPELRDAENVPLKWDVDEYFAREVAPFRPDAWMDRSKDKVGYEINFNRHFYRYVPPRALAEIDAELEAVEREILGLLKEVTV